MFVSHLYFFGKMFFQGQKIIRHFKIQFKEFLGQGHEFNFWYQKKKKQQPKNQNQNQIPNPKTKPKQNQFFRLVSRQPFPFLDANISRTSVSQEKLIS